MRDRVFCCQEVMAVRLGSAKGRTRPDRKRTWSWQDYGPEGQTNIFGPWRFGGSGYRKANLPWEEDMRSAAAAAGIEAPLHPAKARSNAGAEDGAGTR